jgi:hypothetical protein
MTYEYTVIHPSITQQNKKYGDTEKIRNTKDRLGKTFYLMLTKPWKRMKNYILPYYY